MSSEFEKLDQREIWRGHVVEVRVERFRHADGVVVERDNMHHPGAVAIVAVDDEHVWLVRQPREICGVPDLLELPAGKLDVAGEPPLETAKRELAEEIGKAAASWEPLTGFFTSCGFSDERLELKPRDRPQRRPAAGGRRGRADRDRPLAAGEARRRDRRHAGRQDADRPAAAPAQAARLTTRSAGRSVAAGRSGRDGGEGDLR